MRLKINKLAIALILSLCAYRAGAVEPRYPNPDTPDKVWQNDRELGNAIEIRTNPIKSSFEAGLLSSPSNITGDGTSYTIVYSTKDYDTNGDYSTSTGIFTAPLQGHYACSASVYTDGNSSGGGFGAATLSLVTTLKTYVGWKYTNASAVGSLNSDRLGYAFSFQNVRMNAGDTALVKLEVDGGAKTVDIADGTTFAHFSCHLVD